ncbi:MAG TPA: ABC transporter permease [Clostridiales bacterium]|nr:ABC transporter permease [Clostridiales bacterium]
MTVTTKAGQPKKRRGQGKDIWRRLCKNRLAVFGMIILVGLVLLAIFADVIAPYPYDLQNYSEAFEFPSWRHPFGTDNYGRDILSRVIYGARISLQIGFISLSGGALMGCILGAVAGFFGGWLDTLIMRFNDILMSIPKTILAIAIATTLGPGLVNAMIAVSISSIPTFARVVRASTLTVKEQEFVEAARAIGASNARIIFRHIFPNVLAPIIVQSTLGVGTSIVLAASLSFLGLGIQPPTPEWGAMLSAARGFIRDQWYMVFFPGLAIMLTVFALNVFGDGLRDALDPKLKN